MAMASELARVEIQGVAYVAARRQGDDGWLAAPDAGASNTVAWRSDPVDALRESGEAVQLPGLDDTSLLPPVGVGAKVVCLQANTRLVVDASDGIPDHPLFFLKARSAFLAPNAPLRLPREAAPITPEAEFAVVVGAPLRHAAPREAREAISGLLVVNDVTLGGIAAADRFSAGPPGEEPSSRPVRTSPGRYKSWLDSSPISSLALMGDAATIQSVLADAELECLVDDEVVYRGTAADYYWEAGVALSFLSSCVGLDPGDIVALGAMPPAGAGTFFMDVSDAARVETRAASVGLGTRNDIRIEPLPAIDWRGLNATVAE